MRRASNYNTKQQKEILEYIISLNGAHVTAAQILGHFAGKGIPVGRTTVYRHLEKLTNSGKLLRCASEAAKGACYQYAGEACRIHWHLKCEKCGELTHFECDALNELRSHVLASHDFEVDAFKTVFYGRCGNCLAEG